MTRNTRGPGRWWAGPSARLCRASAHSPVQVSAAQWAWPTPPPIPNRGVLRRICWCRKTMRAITLTRRPFRRPPPCMACFPARWKWAAMRSCSSCSSPWAEQSGRLSAGGRRVTRYGKPPRTGHCGPPCVPSREARARPPPLRARRNLRRKGFPRRLKRPRRTCFPTRGRITTASSRLGRSPARA